MRRFWGWLGLNLGRRAGTVALIGLLVTLTLGIGIVKVRFSTSNSDYLNSNDPAWIDNVNYSKVFGGDPMAVLFTMNPGKTVADLFTKSNQAKMQSIESRLLRDPWVFSAVTPLDAMNLSQLLLSSPNGVLDSPAAVILENAVKRDPSVHSKALRANYLVAEGTIENTFPYAKQTLTNPKWVNFLIHEPWGKVRTAVSTFVPNNQHALLAVYLKGNLNINQESAAASSVLKIVGGVHFQNATTITTGVPALLETINNYLKHGIKTLALVAAAIMVAILMLAFTVRWRLLAFAVVAVGVVWGFGLVGYFGIPLTLATIAALPVLLGVGMDYAIQMHSRIEEEVVLARAPHPIQAAARGLGPALLVVTFDAVFAFMALWFAKTPAIREFGSLLVVGIIAVCVCSIIATLAILGIREYKSPTKGKDFSQSRMARLVVFLGSLPVRAALPLAGLAIVVFLGGVAVEGSLHIQTDPIQWVNPHSPAIKDIDTLKAGTGSDNELAINVTSTHPFSNQTVDYVINLSRRMQAEYPKYLYPAAGLINTVDEFVNSVAHTTHVYPTGAQIEGLYLAAPAGIRKTTVADSGGAINIIFRGRTDLLSQLEPVVKTLQNNTKAPPGLTEAPGGIALVGVGLIQNLEKSRVLLTYLALLFVGAFLAVRLRSLVRSLLSLVPVLVAVGAVSLFAAAFNLQLSPVTAVAGPLVVAVCTEFTSLILLRFVEERARGYSPREAMNATARRTGRAFLVSAMTAVAGIGTLATSSMPLLSDFGIIVALNVSVALLSALVVLPPILVWAEGRGWVTRGLISKKAEPPFIEFERDGGATSVSGAGVADAPDVSVFPEIRVFKKRPVSVGVSEGLDEHKGASESVVAREPVFLNEPVFSQGNPDEPVPLFIGASVSHGESAPDATQ
jgi:hydrophobe/amphiphile efflux-3 (HAE3) family protein